MDVGKGEVSLCDYIVAAGSMWESRYGSRGRGEKSAGCCCAEQFLSVNGPRQIGLQLCAAAM